MHTLQKNIHHNKRLIEFCLEKAYPDGNITVERLINDNLVNGTQVAELAVSKTSGIKLDSIGYGKDLVDGSDVKTVTIYSRNKKQFYYKGKVKTDKFKVIVDHRALIHDLNSKIGSLRIILYNPFHDRWYYLVVPNHEYKNNLEIRTNINTGNILGKLAKYEVDSWDRLCAPCTFQLRNDG